MRSCKYVLSQNYENRNWTIFVHFKQTGRDLFLSVVWKLLIKWERCIIKLGYSDLFLLLNIFIFLLNNKTIKFILIYCLVCKLRFLSEQIKKALKKDGQLVRLQRSFEMKRGSCSTVRQCARLLMQQITEMSLVRSQPWANINFLSKKHLELLENQLGLVDNSLFIAGNHLFLYKTHLFLIEKHSNNGTILFQ